MPSRVQKHDETATNVNGGKMVRWTSGEKFRSKSPNVRLDLAERFDDRYARLDQALQPRRQEGARGAGVSNCRRKLGVYLK